MKQRGSQVELSVEELKRLLANEESFEVEGKTIHVHVERKRSPVNVAMSWTLAGFTIGFAVTTAVAFAEQLWDMLVVSLILTLLFFVGYRINSRGE